MSYRIGQLILTPASKNNTISEVFVAQPDADKEALAGKIFILIEIETKRSDGLKLANFLINYINNSYYQNEKLVLKERIPSLRIEHIFESVVSKANKKILEFIKEENIKISTHSLNSTIGLIYNNEIHFSTAGKNRALLIYQKIQNNTKSYKTIDLNKNKDDSEDSSITKLFTNVISGAIPDGSTFVFSNETLPEYLSTKQLTDIITTLPPTSAVEQIKNTLSQINEYVSFIGVIIKSSQLKSDEIVVPLEKPKNIQDSISKLNHTEQSTESILSPSGNIKIKTYLKKIYTFFVSLKPGKDKENLFLKTGSNLNTRAFKFYLNKGLSFIRSLLVIALNSLFYVIKSIGNAEKINKLLTLIKDSFKKITSLLRSGPKNLKGKYKFIFIVLLISIAGILYEINKANNEKLIAEQVAQYQEIKNTIDQKQNQAEANLLYNNEDSAKELLKEIKDLLSQFPQNTEEEKNDYAIFYEKLITQQNKVQKIFDIPGDNIIVNFSAVNKNSKVKDIVLLNDNIYAGDPDQNSIYIHNIKDNITTTITDLNKKLENINYPIISDDQTIYWYSEDQISKLNTETEELFNLALEKNPDTNISAMASYNQRTYMLDNKLSQIYRYDKGDNGFLKYDNWLNAKTDLSKTISLDIDGFIYTLDSDGTIRKFLSGDEEDFIQDLVEPSLENADKIIVSRENDFIYILDSDNSRIIIYKKDGKFVQQYQSKILESINDFVVSKDDQIIYLLSNNAIFYTDINILN